jgi:S-phase kinase-associated protein 1
VPCGSCGCSARDNQLTSPIFVPRASPALQPLRSNNMSDMVPEWDAKFVDVEQQVLFELILAANYMDIRSLLDLACAKVRFGCLVARAVALRLPLPLLLLLLPLALLPRPASHPLSRSFTSSPHLQVASMIKGKTPEQIRSTFNIRNDFTPEEEAEIKEEIRWCEEA